MALDINGMLGATTEAPKTETPVAKATEANAAFKTITAGVTAPTDIFAGLAEQTISTSQFDELEAGTYTAGVNKITIKLSSTNSPLGVVSYKVLDGDKTGRLAFETLFFAQQDGTLNTKSVGKLAKVLQVVHKVEEDKAIGAAKAVLIAFGQGGQKDLVIDKAPDLPENTGTLKISEYKYTPKSGANAGVERTGKNFSFNSVA